LRDEQRCDSAVDQSRSDVLTGIFGARRAWTVSMISALSIPWRYLQGSEVVGVGIPLPPLTVVLAGVSRRPSLSCLTGYDYIDDAAY
jgi:hypothetical protein